VRTAEPLSTLAHDADIMWNYYGSADKAHAILDVQQTAQRLPLVLMLVIATLISLLFVLCPAQSTRALVTCLACRCCDHPDMPPFERLYDPHFDVLVEEQGGSRAEAYPPHGADRRAPRSSALAAASSPGAAARHPLVEEGGLVPRNGFASNCSPTGPQHLEPVAFVHPALPTTSSSSRQALPGVPTRL